jgi:hypothetical protein
MEKYLSEQERVQLRARRRNELEVLRSELASVKTNKSRRVYVNSLGQSQRDSAGNVFFQSFDIPALKSTVEKEVKKSNAV